MATTPEAEPLLDQLAATANRIRAAQGVPGCAIGVIAAGAVRSIGLGVANQENGQPVTTGTLFRLCSLSKPFTATLLMSLVEEGLIDLDRPVVSYLPDLPLASVDARATLTLRHLLAHTAGFECELPGDLERFGADDRALERAIGEYGRLRQWLSPGTEFGYSNAGYWLAGAVAAHVAGRTFEDALRSRILEPLGMGRTCFSASEAILYPVALPYRAPAPDDATLRPVGSFAFPRARIPSGGLIASIDDLLRFTAWHLESGEGPSDGPSVSRGLRSQQREHVIPSGLPGQWRGLGWGIATRSGAEIVGHGGSFGGYHTVMTLVPGLGAAVAVLTNGDGGRRVTEGIRETFLDSLLGPAERGTFTEMDVSDTELDRYVGTYADPSVPGATVIIGRADGGLSVTWPSPDGGEPPEIVRFRPIEPTKFVEADNPTSLDRLTFFLDGGQAPIAVRIGERIGGRLHE